MGVRHVLRTVADRFLGRHPLKDFLHSIVNEAETFYCLSAAKSVVVLHGFYIHTALDLVDIAYDCSVFSQAANNQPAAARLRQCYVYLLTATSCLFESLLLSCSCKNYF